MELKDIYMSIDETHHLKDDKPIYRKRFGNVQSFHEPGIAAVEDETGAYHIDPEGNEIYEKRYEKTYGFYDGLAAVKDESGWYHIDTDGNERYINRYDWVGNFQEGLCTVRENSGKYFHIDKTGKPVYSNRYRYAGDYKYGIAVVYKNNGLATHIDKHGDEIHGKEYIELDVFHKGYAIARDEEGFFHISKDGEPLYPMRYEWVEPFYNGKAFVRKYDGRLMVIDETTHTETVIRDKNNDYCKGLSRDDIKKKLVGYWNTQILYCIAKSEILDRISDGNITVDKLTNILGMPKESVRMLLDVLKIWGMIAIEDDELKITEVGKMLTEDAEKSLKYPALMWGEEHYLLMSKLLDALRSQKPQFESLFGTPFFDYLEDHSDKHDIYNRSLDAYAYDYTELIEQLPISDAHTLMDVGGGTGHLLVEILKNNHDVKKCVLFDLPQVVSQAKEMLDKEFLDKIEFVEGNFFEDELPKCDEIIMSRVIHDWNDEKAEQILKKVNHALNIGGKLIVLEMLVPEELEKDFGVTLNFNLLVMLGGRERTKNEFEKLFLKTGFELEYIIPSSGIISALICRKVKVDGE